MVADARGATREVGCAADVALGDLVYVRDDGAEIIAANRSELPIEQQDWWRLLRTGPNLVRRSEILRRVRTYLHDHGFIELETPLLTRGPAVEPHLKSVSAMVCGERRWLITSPEYHLKRVLSCGFEKVYSLGRVFRDDEIGAHHRPEFTMLEWYRVGQPVDALMDDVAALVAIAQQRQRPWTRITVAEALRRWADAAPEDPDEIVRLLVERVEPQLAPLGCVFLTEYPAALASLARLDPDRPEISERFEAYVDGIELANGFGELTDAEQQRARFEDELRQRRAANLEIVPLDERFLDALACGLPPVSGIALGIDRLVMLGVAATDLNDVVPFPHECS